MKPSKKTLIALAICAPFLFACSEQAADADAPSNAVDDASSAPAVTADVVPGSAHGEGVPPPSREPDVIYVPTPEPVVDAMLNLAGVKEGDVLYDLGSGDGRIPITAAKRFGITAVGVDIDPQRIAEARKNAEEQGVTDKVTFIQGDLFEQDLSKATVISLYLLPSLNLKLRPTLLKLKPGTRIVSHAFDMGDWKPDQTATVNGRTVYFWTVPQQ